MNPSAGGSAPRRTRAQIEAHRTEAFRLHLRGLTETQIGQRLGIDQQVVSRDLRAVNEEWIAKNQAERAALRAEAVAGFAHVQSEALAAWDRSQEEHQVTETEQVNLPPGKEGDTAKSRSRARVKREKRDGDPNYLMAAIGAGKEVAELRNLYPPKKTALTDSEGRDLFSPGAIDEVLRAAGKAD